jgi:hypothetical protein
MRRGEAMPQDKAEQAVAELRAFNGITQEQEDEIVTKLQDRGYTFDQAVEMLATFLAVGMSPEDRAS